MKKMNKKGFTIVELVIVIAVIAILAAVLIPTFSGIVDKANVSAVQQEARNVYTEIYAEDLYDGVINGETKTDASHSPYTGTYSYATANGKVSSFSYKKGDITIALNISTGKWEKQ